MANPGAGSFPPAAIEWLAPADPGWVLAVGTGSLPTALRYARRGHRITLVDKDGGQLGRIADRHPDLLAVVAAPEALPFAAHSYDQVLVAQGLHLLAPGLALAEFARVLAPGASLAVLYTVRDDSVPWVRRLATLLQTYDPELMSGTPAESTEAIEASGYFPRVHRRDFRQWVPTTRDGLIDLVTRSPRLAHLGEPDASILLERVGAIYDASARAPEPLLLPYSVRCWRARVDHSEFTTIFGAPESGLQISL